LKNLKISRIKKVNTLIEKALETSKEAISILKRSLRNLKNLAELIWEVYSKVEYSIFLLQLNLDGEIGRGQKGFLKKDILDVRVFLNIISDNSIDAFDNHYSSDFHNSLKDVKMPGMHRNWYHHTLEGIRVSLL